MTVAFANPFASLFRPIADRPGTPRPLEVKPKKKPTPRPKPANPWGLSAVEESALRAIVEHGQHGGAAESIGISERTLEFHLGTARKKMGAANRVLAILAWDRYARGAQ